MSNDEWWADVFNSDASVAQTIIKNLAWDHGVKLLALDFDLTIVNINTGGKWKKSPEKLAKHVRPCFKELIRAALKHGGVRVSIVTFSVQPALISDMLKSLLPTSNTENIIIEANATHIHPQLSPEVYRVGKQKHIKKVTKRLFDQYGIVIEPHQIILFDDRSRYIYLAKQNGNLAFEVNNDVTLDDIRKFVEKLSKPGSSSDPKIPAQASTSSMVSVLAISQWPPKSLDKNIDGWTGPLNVMNIGMNADDDDGDADGGTAAAKTILALNKDNDNKSGAMKLGTSVVAVRYN